MHQFQPLKSLISVTLVSVCFDISVQSIIHGFANLTRISSSFVAEDNENLWFVCANRLFYSNLHHAQNSKCSSKLTILVFFFVDVSPSVYPDSCLTQCPLAPYQKSTSVVSGPTPQQRMPSACPLCPWAWTLPLQLLQLPTTTPATCPTPPSRHTGESSSIRLFCWVGIWEKIVQTREYD